MHKVTQWEISSCRSLLPSCIVDHILGACRLGLFFMHGGLQGLARITSGVDKDMCMCTWQVLMCRKWQGSYGMEDYRVWQGSHQEVGKDICMCTWQVLMCRKWQGSYGVEDYRIWQGSHQEWVRTCACAHDKSWCAGNVKGHMMCLVQDCRRTAAGHLEWMYPAEILHWSSHRKCQFFFQWWSHEYIPNTNFMGPYQSKSWPIANFLADNDLKWSHE